MSTSRLEKFIYAICSMEVSDLPAPLSRIEILWNCLITGETPDFEPQSRNEQYLMAMLGLYELENLPTPISRGEKLLYKIAVGETDLSDVPGYLSRYEELLKYLIENGGISGGDFEYVLYTINQSLYTLYTTAEKPVKSAILSGNTLVNLSEKSTSDIQTITDTSVLDISLRYTLKSSTVYTAIFNALTIESPNDTWCGFLGTNGWGSNSVSYSMGINKIKLSTYGGSECSKFRIRGNKNTFKNLIILEGDYTKTDIPYFEGMQSVKMPVLTTTGKNLFNGEIELGGYYGSSGLPYNASDRVRSKAKTFLPKGTYTLSSDGATLTSFSIWNMNGTFFQEHAINNSSKNTITLTEDKMVNVTIVNESLLNSNIQIEEGSTTTSYEPFKSNILTVNEDVTLRGIGEVRDELDAKTGEVAERIGEVVLDGTSILALDKWEFGSDCTEFSFNAFGIKGNGVTLSNFAKSYLKSDRPINRETVSSNNIDNTYVLITIQKSKLATDSVEGMNQYLQSNPITVQYELTTPINKTVDLTVVDQDNQPTQLGTFKNITHVSLEAENLIPEVEMEVATIISKELASASPLMDDISTNQQQLESTVDEQSNNVDATMIATTEIYEEIL